MNSPARIGLPSKYDQWRPNQYDALWRLLDSERRFKVAVMPTGFGKSLLYMAYTLLDGARAIMLTSTKRLSSQLMKDFEELGLVEIRGANNYECTLPPPDKSEPKYRSADKGWCKAGVECKLRNDGCPYYDRVRSATKSKLVVTNYAYWMNSSNYGEGLGGFDTVVMDEAHSALEELSDFLCTTISETDVMLLGLGYPSVANWRQWVIKAAAVAERYTKMTDIFDNVIHFKRLLQDLQRLMIGKTEDWVFEHDGTQLRWTIAWPAPLAEKYLFRNVQDIVLTSATVTQKLLSMLNVDKESYDFIEYDSDFPIERRPVYYYPVAKLAKTAPKADFAAVFDAMDDAIDKRLDRKGIIHTHSYDLRDAIWSHSRHRPHMIRHNRRNAEQTIEQFRRMPAPAILLSPSMTTGVDFPYTDCEYQLIPKIPFPDRTSRVLRAREQKDKHYSILLTMTTLQQMVGRGMRATDDQCETIIYDKNFTWLRNRYRNFATRWFWSSVLKIAELPDPPPPLTTSQMS